MEGAMRPIADQVANKQDFERLRPARLPRDPRNLPVGDEAQRELDTNGDHNCAGQPRPGDQDEEVEDIGNRSFAEFGLLAILRPERFQNPEQHQQDQKPKMALPISERRNAASMGRLLSDLTPGPFPQL